MRSVNPVIAVLMLAVLAGPALSAERVWSNVTGRVVSCGDDVVFVDYGDGRVPVALDGLSWCIRAAEMGAGLTVTAYGYVTGSLETARRFDAVGLYIHDEHMLYAGTGTKRMIGQTIFADPMAVRDGNPINAIGRIVDISGEEFKIDTGRAVIAGDTGKMTYNPFAPGTATPISIGDFVAVEGHMDTGPFRRYEVQAEVMVRMVPSGRL